MDLWATKLYSRGSCDPRYLLALRKEDHQDHLITYTNITHVFLRADSASRRRDRPRESERTKMKTIEMKTIEIKTIEMKTIEVKTIEIKTIEVKTIEMIEIKKRIEIKKLGKVKKKL